LHKIGKANAKNRVARYRRLADTISVMMNWFEKTPSLPATTPACEVCPLSCVQAGLAVRIKELCAPPETQQRLREIGLCEDQIIRLITSQSNFICQVCNARLAISEQLAKLILVEPLASPALAPIR
jgi:Fe2+ transport system protein FeoA